MHSKDKLRKKYFFIRKKKYFEISPNFFNPLIKLVKKGYKKRKILISSYYPTSFEVDTLKLFESVLIKKLRVFLPVIKKK